MPALVALLALKSGLTKEKSEEFLKEFFKLISETLCAGETVKIKAFGTFKILDVDMRKSINISNGDEIIIPGHKRIVFLPSKEIAEVINAPFSMFESVELHPDAVAEIEGAIPSDTKSVTSIDSSEKDYVLENSAKRIQEEKDSPEKEKNRESDPDKKQGNENSPVKNEDFEKTPVKEEKKEELSNLDSDSIPDSTKEAPMAEVSPTEAPSAETPTAEAPIGEAPTAEALTAATPIEEASILEKRKKSSSGKFVFGFIVGLLFALIIGMIFYFYYIRKAEEKEVEKNAVEIPVTDTIGEAENVDGLDSADESISFLDPSSNEEAPSDADSNDAANEKKEIKEEAPATDPSDRPSEKGVKDVIGDRRFLTTMAQSHYGNYNLWPYIYEENKSFLGHPDRIKPGTEVVVPPLSKYGVDPNNPDDIKKAKRLGVEIYKRYEKTKK